MTQHDVKTCPRCGQPFECKVGSITACDCNSVQLSFAETEYIKAKFDDCVCLKCLEELQSEYANIHGE